MRGGFGAHPFVQHQLRRARACAARRSGSRCRPGPGSPRSPMARATASSSSRITWSATRSGAGRAGDRAQDVGVRDVLQRAHVGLRPRGAAADQQHRRARQRGVGHGGDGVGDAGAGGDHRHAELAGQLGMGMRHVHGGAFVRARRRCGCRAGRDGPRSAGCGRPGGRRRGRRRGPARKRATQAAQARDRR